MLIVLAIAGVMAIAHYDRQRQSGPIGLFTSLPLLWNETGALEAELDPTAPPHWARQQLERRGRIVALDALVAQNGGPDPLAAVSRLVIAQPRALSPDENVALDGWLRRGGKLLILADPALTESSRFALGDPRRPPDSAMLSPVLAHWGLVLQFDERQAPGELVRDVLGVRTPTNLPGRLLTHGQANCRIWSEGLAVTCAIGKGRLVVLADSALLERRDPSGLRPAAFAGLLDAAFVGD